ncbi:cofilin-2-like [Patiria miniata]|uniref:ADF-H domain-containing protein n=1 Tax=Patiria miniata TaxID=46514 RepID=A0A914AC38_PATMI|nr:cofilin-2-like [Patiria miniata]
MKNDHKYPWAIFKIQQNRVVVDTLGTGGYEEFIVALTASGEPRYALYDVPQDWVYAEFNIVFIFWIPDDVPWSKAVPYGRTVVGLKQKFTGIKTIMEAYGTASSIKDDMIYTVNKWYVGK